VKVLPDADVLLDTALRRQPFAADSDWVIQWCQETPQAAMVARHGISNLYYLLSLALDEAKARKFISDRLHFVVVASGVPMRFDMHWPFRGGILKTPCKWRQRFRRGRCDRQP
jgi:hypothetical protein